VDADQRPDIARRYAPEGLPTVVFLNSNGIPLKNDEDDRLYSLYNPQLDSIHQKAKEMLSFWRRRIYKNLPTPQFTPWQVKELSRPSYQSFV